MGLFRRKPKRVRAAPVGVCDVCNARLPRTEAYFLTTRQVVVSPAYWDRRLDLTLGIAETFGIPESQMPQLVQDSVVSAAGQGTPWAVCEACSADFTFDRTEARAHAVASTAPPGTGKVDPRLCADVAAAAYERRGAP
ncbi:hypothetical protein WEI85_37760 [Actinomycetes bacterium KLBMP 9797]